MWTEWEKAFWLFWKYWFNFNKDVLGWKLSPFVFYRLHRLQNTNGLSFQPNNCFWCVAHTTQTTFVLASAEVKFDSIDPSWLINVPIVFSFLFNQFDCVGLKLVSRLVICQSFWKFTKRCSIGIARGRLLLRISRLWFMLKSITIQATRLTYLNR